ncbi:glycosyltransferase [Vibrio astriarenae]|uniref:glycosyltransferase n=1 Tax=Vibrio astriarenae TaxID=1481923 RepID=UPI003736D45F
MKRIIVFGTDPSKLGGIETFSKNLEKLGFNVNYVTFYRGGNTSSAARISYLFKFKYFDYLTYRVLAKVSKSLSNRIISRKIKRLCNPSDIALVNLHYRDFILPCEALNVKNKFVVQHVESSQFISHRLYCACDCQIIDAIQRSYDVVAISPQESEALIQSYRFNPDNVRTIRHMSRIPKLGVSKSGGKNIVIISRLDNDVKKVDLVIKTMRKLPDYNLHIYGSGRDELYISSLCDEFDNVFFKGEIDNVIPALDLGHIFVMNSEHEGYGLTLIEAMTRGLPIIARNTYTSLEDIVDGNGVIIPKDWSEDDFVVGIRKIEANYKVMSERALVLSERYSLNMIKQEWEDFL